MKRFSKLLCFMIVFLSVMAALCTVSFAATIGQPLTNVENGWKRIDDSDSKINYNGKGWNIGNVFLEGMWENSAHYSQIAGDTVNFKFYGTKLRIIQFTNPSHNSRVYINIDGAVESYSEITPAYLTRTFVYEKTGLALGMHSVSIYITSGTAGWFGVDAIDIDDTGYLVDINTPVVPTNLDAAAGNKEVNLKWDRVEGAINYNIKRSETPGGPYQKIASTTAGAITYSDSGLENGRTYYYVVSAIVNGIESPNSNEVSATPIAPPDPEPSGNNAILEITMVTGEIKEYDLTAAELQGFLTWYDGRSNGADKAYYMIPKKNNIKPFLSRKEYIAFDKISSFEVKEYAD